jgi:hypothetical protein
MIVMDVTIHQTFLPYDDPDRADEGKPDVLLEAGQIEPGDADGDREGGPA